MKRERSSLSTALKLQQGCQKMYLVSINPSRNCRAL